MTSCVASLENTSIISGTMQVADVAPALFDFLVGENRKAAADFVRAWGNPHTWDFSTPALDASESAWKACHARLDQYDYATWEVLFDKLNALAPEGFYFGSHPGDGSDYGFWAADDDIPY